jgi:phage shock protein E
MVFFLERKSLWYNYRIMNHHMITIVGIVVALVLVGSVMYFARCDDVCQAQELRGETQNFSHISAASFNEQLSGGVVIDVRTPEEYVTGHLPGAVLIDINAADFKDRIGQLDRTVPYYVYCRSGNRSRAAVDVMKTAGFKNVYGLDGGIGAWQRAGFAVE